MRQVWSTVQPLFHVAVALAAGYITGTAAILGLAMGFLLGVLLGQLSPVPGFLLFVGPLGGACGVACLGRWVLRSLGIRLEWLALTTAVVSWTAGMLYLVPAANFGLEQSSAGAALLIIPPGLAAFGPWAWTLYRPVKLRKTPAASS